MKWRGRRGSTNVRDARSQRVRAGGAGLGNIINVVLRMFGIKGVLVLIDPAALLGGGQVQTVDYRPSPQEEEQFQFVTVVLADTEDTWTQEFERVGRQYREPELVIYRSRHPTACGMGDARMGPFYCPADKKIYIDLGFYDDLAGQFVIRNIANGQEGDIAEAMNAANQIGDDAIQSRTQGRVTPHAFTHGTSEQRMRWFLRGFDSGRLEDGDTFEQPYESL